MVGSLGDIIRERRSALGMTQARLAELVGRSPSTVRAWERDRTAPGDAEVLRTLAAVLGADLDQYVTDLTAVPGSDAEAASSVRAPDPGSGEVSGSGNLQDEPPRDEALLPSPEEETPVARVIGTATADRVEIFAGPRPGPRATVEAATNDDAAAPAGEMGGASEREVAASAAQPSEIAPEVGATPSGPEKPHSPGEPAIDMGETRGLPKTPTNVFGLGPGAGTIQTVEPEIETYLDDPDEARLYQIRAGLTAGIGLLLLLLFRWAAGNVMETLSTMWEIFTGAF